MGVCGGTNGELPTPPNLHLSASTPYKLVPWLDFIFSNHLVEEGIDDTVQAHSAQEETCRDVLGSQMWRDLGEYPTVRGNLVFAFYIDWFIPYTNKLAGKKVSVGSIYWYV